MSVAFWMPSLSTTTWIRRARGYGAASRRSESQNGAPVFRAAPVVRSVPVRTSSAPATISPAPPRGLVAAWPLRVSSKLSTRRPTLPRASHAPCAPVQPPVATAFTPRLGVGLPCHKLEALHAGTKIAGEREAAQRAAERIRARLAEIRGREQEVEYRYSLPDPWKRKLFVALCRRYGLKPYREYGQRYSSVMVRVPQTFQERTLWPHFQAVSKELNMHLDELTTRVIREAIDEDVSEAAETTSPKALPAPSGE